MSCKNSCRILFPIYNCRGKRILFLRRTNRMTFFIIRQEKYFFSKSWQCSCRFPKQYKKRIVKVRHGKTCRSEGRGKWSIPTKWHFMTTCWRNWRRCGPKRLIAEAETTCCLLKLSGIITCIRISPDKRTVWNIFWNPVAFRWRNLPAVVRDVFRGWDICRLLQPCILTGPQCIFLPPNAWRRLKTGWRIFFVSAAAAAVRVAAEGLNVLPILIIPVLNTIPVFTPGTTKTRFVRNVIRCPGTGSLPAISTVGGKSWKTKKSSFSACAAPNTGGLTVSG